MEDDDVRRQILEAAALHPLIEAPLDFMSDTLRGMRGVMLDMLRRPAQPLEAEQRLAGRAPA